MVLKRVICLMGPTASGKTALALKLAGSLPLDIISVDSAMIYRGMDIGTAKPSPDVLLQTPHYLIDLCDPSQAYSVGDFYRDVHSQIETSLNALRTPLLVGGTMMYFRALQQGLAALPPANSTIRVQLLDEATTHGWAYLHRRLEEIDPVAAKRIHHNDKQRIQRALEVYYVSGQSMSAYQTMTNHDETISFSWFALFPEDRALLHATIAARFHAMLAAGLIAEVEALFARGDLSRALPSIRSVNYRQVWEYLLGETSYDEMVMRAIAATRQLAKRQLTWLRSFKDVRFLSGDINESIKAISAS